MTSEFKKRIFNSRELPIFLLGSLILLVFFQNFGHSLLLWDDQVHICKNPLVTSFSFESFKTIWVQPYFNLYAPLTYTFWGALNKIITTEYGQPATCQDLSVWLHGTSILLHFANTVLVFKILSQQFQSGGKRIIFLVTALFAIHPLQVETVSWVSAQRDLLSTFLGLFGIYLFCINRWKTANALLVFALLAKATAVVFPFLALILVWKKGSSTKRLVLTLSPAIIAAMVLGIYAKVLQPDVAFTFESPIWFRPLISLQSFGFYLTKFLIPLYLAPDNGRSVPRLMANTNELYPALVSVTLLVSFYFKSIRNVLCRPLLWLVISILPVSGIVNFGFQEISTVADRFAYLGIISLCLILLNFYEAKPFSKWTYSGIAVALVTFSCLSISQVKYWKNDETLFTMNFLRYPGSAVSALNIGNSLLTQNQPAKAEEYFRKAIAINQRTRGVYYHLGLSLERQGKDTEAAEAYAIEIDSKNASANTYNNFAGIMYRIGNKDDAEIFWKKTASLDKKHFNSRYNLGIFYFEKKNFTEALRYMLEAEYIDPQNPNVKANIMNIKKALTSL